MSFRIEVIDALEQDLIDSGLFKKIYKNVGVHWTQVRNFPAISIIYEQEQKIDDNMTRSGCKYEGLISFVVYNTQARDHYEDNLSDLIDAVYTIIRDNEYLRCNALTYDDIYFKRDGGTAHPYSVALITLKVKYKAVL